MSTVTSSKNGTLNKLHSEKFQNFSTVSAQIRFLDYHNFTRGAIVKYITAHGLNRSIRYQHVRNVLITPITNPKEKF